MIPYAGHDPSEKPHWGKGAMRPRYRHRPRRLTLDAVLSLQRKGWTLREIAKVNGWRMDKVQAVVLAWLSAGGAG